MAETVHIWIPPVESPSPVMQRTHDHESRYVKDAALATSVSARGPQGPLVKRKIASFFSHDYSAERDDEGNLRIYHTSAGLGTPVSLVGGSAGDAAPGMNASKLQAINEAWRARNAPVKRVRATGQ